MNRSIRLTLFITLILLSWQIAPAAAGNADQAPPPNIMIPDPLYTFDAVVDGIEVVHDFRVYNRGTGELTIEKVQTG